MSGKNFFDRFKKPAEKKGNNSNPIAGWFGNNNNKSSFGGAGQSLGGSQPGKVIPVELSEPGPLGLKVEKRPNSEGTAIVQQVIAGSQAERAGLQRGDILCFAGSDGSEEIMFDMFMELAKSDQRPLCFEVRRVPKTKSAPNTTESKPSSAETFARKQAVIAAAEAREREHKKKSKPVTKGSKKDNLPQILSAADKRKLEEERQQRIEDDKAKELSAATQQALAAAKSAEQKTADELGYNPYETKSMTSGQARNAVVSTTHGNMQQSQQQTIPAVSAPPDLPAAAEDNDVSPEFQQAFETTVTSNPDHAAVVNSITTMRKLIVNATTKGQATNTEDAAKFRKIRLSNPKIVVAVTEVSGAVDLLLSTGFELHHDGATDETILLYPPVDAAALPSWLPTALNQMEQYAKS